MKRPDHEKRSVMILCIESGRFTLGSPMEPLR